jgi:DDE superfamily endonuclease
VAHPRAFPPSVVVEVKALACELPHRRGLPLSRFSLNEICQEIMAEGIVARISGATLWRWLSRDALRPWRYRSWIFPRDPEFGAKAGRVLDLYQGRWEGRPLSRRDFVLCADEKTSIQARLRKHASLAGTAGRVTRVEHEYQRAGAWAYLATWDVQRARLFGRCEPTTGIEPFDRLVAQVMAQEPYCSARRVFWVVDNGSSHRGEKAARRLPAQGPARELVHTPSHARWLSPNAIYFSIGQRKVLAPNDFVSRCEVEERLLGFQQRYQQAAQPFRWTFTRADLLKLLARLAPKPRFAAAA